MLGRRLFEASGAGGFSNNGALPLGSLRASGSSDVRDGDQYWGFVNGSVTKHATRVRVLFDLGIPPLDVERRHRDASPVTGSGTVPGHGEREPSATR